MNILAIDVGNSRVAIGACRGGKARAVERLATDRLAETVPAAVGRLAAALSDRPVPRLVVSSVSPPIAAAVVEAAGTAVDWPVLVVGRDIELPMELAVDEPAAVGTDRVLTAAAAFEAVGGPVVVASFGTALTINAVSAEGVFLGGVICPGLRIGAKALHEATAALPQVEPARPNGPCGKSTVSAIQAGLFYAAGGTLREVVERMASELGGWPHLVLTGGDAELVAGAYEFVDSVVPDLCLIGVNLAYRRHVERTGKR